MRFEVWRTIYVMAAMVLAEKTYDYGEVYTVDNLPIRDDTNEYSEIIENRIKQFLSVNKTHYDKFVSCLASKTLSDDVTLTKMCSGSVGVEVFVLDCSGEDAVTGRDHCKGNLTEYQRCFDQAGIYVDALGVEGSSDEEMMDIVTCRLGDTVKLDEEGFFKVFDGVTGSGPDFLGFDEYDDATESTFEEVRFLLYEE